jgi:hypothetical protein
MAGAAVLAAAVAVETADHVDNPVPMKTSKIYQLVVLLLVSSTQFFAQTDIDAIRLSRTGIGGSSRYLAMGGAFGAVGADLGTAATNPAGLALFRRGEISFSGGMFLTANKATVYNKASTVRDLRFVFNNFGIAVTIPSQRDPENRHVVSFVNTQLQNFFSSTRMTGYTNNSSIARDMVNIANEKKHANNLNPSYEGLAFNTYLLDTIDGKFVSLLDVNRTIRQTRDIVTSGKINDLNFSYAFTYKDKYYIGASVGIPQVDYISTTTHYEYDDNDSIRLEFQPDGSYTHTFKEGMPAVHEYYRDMGAFNAMSYEEYFKTSGSGFNLKLGAVTRVNEMLRLGFYYHTPTIYRLTDSYINEMSVTFDKAPNTAEFADYPADGGVFNYRVITPSRVGANGAFVFGKKAVIGLDYEMINYSKAQLRSGNLSEFESANSAIISKYTMAHNVRFGIEYNMSPVLIRAGYYMNGSPFGEAFAGRFVRNSISFGGGFRAAGNFFMDIAWVQTLSSDDYYLFTNLPAKAKIDFSNTLISITGGLKF